MGHANRSLATVRGSVFARRKAFKRRGPDGLLAAGRGPDRRGDPESGYCYPPHAGLSAEWLALVVGETLLGLLLLLNLFPTATR